MTGQYFQSPHPSKLLDPEPALIAEFEKAKTSIYFAIYALTVPAIAQGIIDAYNRGVQVRGVMDGGQARYTTSQIGPLKAAGVDVLPWNEGTYHIMHDKVAVIDNTTVVIGSYNWTGAAEKNNVECMMLLYGNKTLPQLMQDQILNAYAQAAAKA